jgi:hypothetical protein
MQTALPKFFLRTLITSTFWGVVSLFSVGGANAANCYFYRINIQGTVTSSASSRSFSVNQFAMWRDTGVRSNPIEFVLTTLTDLNVSPQIGQILLLTNSAFANNLGVASARFNLAQVTRGNGVVRLQLDPGQSLIPPPSNVFIAPGVGTSPGGLGGLGFLTGAGADLAQLINGASILSTYYLIPRNGGVVFSTSGNNINGQIDIAGSGIDNASLQGRYTGRFSGSYAGSVVCN